jgi:hypothetical protein
MTFQEERKPDVDAIPAGLMRGERLLFIYTIFAAFLVWYVSEKLLVWEPNGGMWGLPKPIVGAIMISATWLLLNWVLFVAYFIVIRRRVKEVSRK